MEIISRMQELWLFDFYYVKLQTQHNLKNLNLNRTETYNFKISGSLIVQHIILVQKKLFYNFNCQLDHVKLIK